MNKTIAILAALFIALPLTAQTVKIVTVKGNDKTGAYSFEYPVLQKSRQLSEQQRKVLNQQLKKDFTTWRFCGVYPGQIRKNTMRSKVHVSYVSAGIISIQNKFFYNCSGAAYPDTGTQFYNYNLPSGKPLSLNGNSHSPQQLHNFIAKQFQQAAILKSGQCLPVYKGLNFQANGYRISISEQGILFAMTGLPHVIQGCGFSMPISCRKLMPYLALKGTLARFCARPAH